MKSKFLGIVEEHYRDIEIRDLADAGKLPITYSDAGARGLLKPVSIRLPVDTLAELDFIQSTGLWSSKQHLIYDIIRSSVEDFYSYTSEDFKNKMDILGKEALETLKPSDKAKSIYPHLPESYRSHVSEEKFISDYEKEQGAK